MLIENDNQEHAISTQIRLSFLRLNIFLGVEFMVDALLYYSYEFANYFCYKEE